MRRFGQIIGIKPEHIEEYERLHAAVWPEVLATIHACNIRNYSTFGIATRSSPTSSTSGMTSRPTWPAWRPIPRRGSGGRTPSRCKSRSRIGRPGRGGQPCARSSTLIDTPHGRLSDAIGILPLARPRHGPIRPAETGPLHKALALQPNLRYIEGHTA